MQITLACPLAQAATALPLPPGGALRIVPVLPVDAVALPAPIRAAAARRRHGFAAGRQAAVTALRAAGQEDAVVPGIGADGLPDWPAGWLGSIAHTDEVAAAVVAPSGPVLGLDVERIMPAKLAAEIAGDVMPEATPGHTAMPLAVTRAFSGKEALYKALYPRTQRIMPFSAARFTWQAGAALLTLTEDWSEEWTAGTTLCARQVVAAGHVLTLVWC